MSKQDANVLPPEYTEGPKPRYTTTTSRNEENAKARIYKLPNRVIPVVFLPGVMGSNLKSTDNETPIWRVNSTLSLSLWISKSSDERKKLLNPGKTQVDPGGKVLKESSSERNMFKSRSSRGWGEVAAMSYGTFLPWLQLALNDHQVLINNRTSMNDRKTLREQLIAGIASKVLAKFKLTSEEVGLSYKYLFPVHAVGYNWLQSNKVSAQRLKNQVDKIVMDYKAAGLMCEKIILVTHSMGGLVGRYYSEVLGGRDSILGIVHGVMPDLGSPMAYKRMKAGEAGVTGKVIGESGAEMTAVLAQSPGPLQLLPGTHYGNGWLKVEGMSQSLPKNGDPYKDIYLERNAWWGLCEDRFINPGNKQMDKVRLDKDWKDYDLLITDKVKTFIEELHGRYHCCTYSFYGDDGKKNPSYAYLQWKDTSYLMYPKNNNVDIAEKGAINVPPDYYNQTVRTVTLTMDNGIKIHKLFTLSPPEDAGDGTVPVSAAFIKSPCLQTQLGISVDHEGAYKEQANGEVHSRWFVLWSIVKILQNIKDTDLKYAE